MSSEIDRFNFLTNRDGLQSAIAWEKRTADIYRIWMIECFGDAQCGAKGLEWATIYCQAARDCDEVIKRYDKQ